MSVAYWSLFVGILLIAMVLGGTLLARLPLSSAMIYLGLGYALGLPRASNPKQEHLLTVSASALRAKAH